MAEAKTIKISREITTTIEEPGVTLTLTVEEAKTLADILSHVGGCPRTSRRKYSQAISMALHRVGYNFVDNFGISRRADRSQEGNIYFKNGRIDG